MYADRFLICGGGKEEPVLKKLSVCVLFGGVSSEHEVSLRSAESVLNRLDKDKYHIFPVGITKDGDWILFGGKDYGMLPAGTWQNCEENRRAALSPVRGQGLLSFENDCVVRERIDVVFPVMHGENCEDGAIQGLLQIAGIPYVGPRVAASAAGKHAASTAATASRSARVAVRMIRSIFMPPFRPAAARSALPPCGSSAGRCAASFR